MTDDTQSSDDGADADDGSDYRQVAFVALAAFALIAAAFVAPVASNGPSDSSEEAGDEVVREPVGQPDGETDGEPDGSLDLDELLEPLLRFLEWLLDLFDPEPPEPPEAERPECIVQFDRDPVPGTTVGVTIIYDGEPLAGADVWFDDERIGTTNDRGRVTGEVPYTRELAVRVDVPGRPDCVIGNEIATANPRVAAGA